jgi:hypothetical protein
LLEHGGSVPRGAAAGKPRRLVAPANACHLARPMRKLRWFAILYLAMAGAAAWRFRGPIASYWHSAGGGAVLGLRQPARPDPKTYATLKADLERWRKKLSARLATARTAKEKAVVEADARVILETVLPAMMHCWLGTPWDFNGTADGPGAGKVACGYFVATVLQDAGFRIDRYRLAQQPSENILRSFLPKSACSLAVGEDFQTFATGVNQREPGVYIIGLDTHVGFVIVKNGGFRCIHSSGSRPWCVVDEDSARAGVIQRSNWRMLGNLTANRHVLRNWLTAEKIAVRGT